MKAELTIFLVLAALVLGDARALTIHRSFGSRHVGFGGGIGCDVPVDAKAAAALDGAREKEAARAKVYVGRVTRVLSGDEIVVVTGGGSSVPVKLGGIVVPDVSQPNGKSAAAFLKKLVHGRQVRVEYSNRDDRGRVLGAVTLNKKDVNQMMVENGMAKRTE